jgi:hypothetical protein
MGTDYYTYRITDFTPTYTSTSQTKEDQSIEKITHSNGIPPLGFKRGVYGDFTRINESYYSNDYSKTISQASWGNKNQQKINFGNDAFSLGINRQAQYTIPTYNLRDNTIQNFTLPNGQNLLSFLKKNNVQNGDNVEIKITKDRVELIKKKK